MNSQPLKDRERIRIVEELCREKGTNSVIEEIYRDLSIIDSKSASLLTFNAIGLAVLAIWLDGIPANDFHLTLDIVFVIFLISCIASLITAMIYWSSRFDLRNKTSPLKTLLNTRKKRTRIYKIAWWCSLISVVILTVVSIGHAIHTHQHSSGKCDENCIHKEGDWGHSIKNNKK